MFWGKVLIHFDLLVELSLYRSYLLTLKRISVTLSDLNNGVQGHLEFEVNHLLNKLSHKSLLSKPDVKCIRTFGERHPKIKKCSIFTFAE